MTRGRVSGIIFSNVHDEMLGMLTQNRCTGSVPYGGRYRLVDFALSNMVNCGIEEVGIITKSNYQSLMDHVGNGKEWDLARKIGGLRILPPFNNTNSGIYRGRVDALVAATGYIKHSKSDYIIIADSDVVSNIDYTAMIRQHMETGADITLGYIKESTPCVSSERAVTLGLNGNKVVDMQIHDTSDTQHNRYLDIAIIGRDLLMRLINQLSSRNLYSFTKDLLQANIGKLAINGFEFETYLKKISNIKTYFESSMDLLKPDFRSELFVKQRPIYTKVRDEVPVVYGLDANVKNSIIADGCTVNGTVENSIIFRGVIIEKGAVVRNSIVMQGTKVGRGSSISYVVCDKTVVITDGRMLMGTDSYPVLISKSTVI